VVFEVDCAFEFVELQSKLLSAKKRMGSFVVEKREVHFVEVSNFVLFVKEWGWKQKQKQKWE
jgi:hypothetical protein